jgi:hypothetical protein
MLHKTFTGRRSEKCRLLLKILITPFKYSIIKQVCPSSQWEITHISVIRIFNKRRHFSDLRPVNVLCNINALSVKIIVCQRKPNCLCILCTQKCVLRLKFFHVTRVWLGNIELHM